MFQYAFALQIKLKNNDKKIYVNDIYQPLNGDNRQLSLSHFHLTEGTEICTRIGGLFHAVCFAFRVCKRVGMRALFRGKSSIKQALTSKKEELFDAGLYFHLNFFNPSRARQNTGDKHIFGYHLTVNSVFGIEDELRKAFTVKTPPSPENGRLLEEIKAQNAVCLHIRRGDYALYPQLQVCNEYYYTSAVKQANEQLENPVFYVFSTGHEDVEWVRQNYHFEGDVRYVDLDNPDYEELRLMMSCKHFIISNSTFSWWAAFLSKDSPDKRVWAPKPWLASTRVEMYLPGWSIIETKSDEVGAL